MTKKVYDILVIQEKRRADIATHFSPREGFEDLVFTSKTNYPINADIFADFHLCKHSSNQTETSGLGLAELLIIVF